MSLLAFGTDHRPADHGRPAVRLHAELSAGRLVSDRLCASGHNFAPIRTIYRWQGQVHDKTEGRVALRTRRSLVPQIVDRAKREHPYEVPSVVAVPIIDGGPDYLVWILEQTEQLARDELRAALVVGASFSHHAQGGGIWPDGRWHARPPAASAANQLGS